MLSCAERYEKGREGEEESRGVVACFSSSRMPRMGKDRNMAGFNKGHWLPPELEHSCIARDTRGLFN